MAEGLLKKHIGNRVYVQSAGVASDRDIDGFSISVCNELGVELTKHTVRSFQELEEWGEDLEGYDLIIAPLSYIENCCERPRGGCGG